VKNSLICNNVILSTLYARLGLHFYVHVCPNVLWHWTNCTCTVHVFAHACIHNYIFLFSFAYSKEIKRQTLIDHENWLCSMHRACYIER